MIELSLLILNVAPLVKNVEDSFGDLEKIWFNLCFSAHHTDTVATIPWHWPLLGSTM